MRLRGRPHQRDGGGYHARYDDSTATSFTNPNRSSLTEIDLRPLTLPLHERVLQNGLRVVLHEEHAAPLVAVHVMYGVGSRHERPGRTGLAHLLEHLLFEGSLNCPKGEFDRLLEAVGGTNNGSTWFDRTNYYEVVPAHAVELALWLERERMAFFLPVLDAAMLELQRGVVINERRQSYENRPYGLADERLHQLLFPPDHPYSWPTIGYMDDLEAIRLDDAREFYESYYTPANAVVVLAGDIAPEWGFELAERYFGDVPAAAKTPAAAPAPGGGAAGGADVLHDRVSFPRVYRASAAPAYGSREWVAFDVLSYVLGDGESSRLERALVREEQLAQEVDTYLYPTALAGIFGVVATARSGVAPERLAARVDAVVREIADGGLAAGEVQAAIRRARRDQIAGLSNVEGRAEEIAYAATVLGEPDHLNHLLNSYVEISEDDVREAAAAVLAGGARLSVVPDAEATHA